MVEKQETIILKAGELLERVSRLAGEGYRLVQIGCTRLDVFQIDYTFDKDYRFLNLRVLVPVDKAEIPSITGIYWCAFTYENEIHDLFGIKVKNLNIDYGGNFYRIAVEAPFNVARPLAKEPDKTPGHEK